MQMVENSNLVEHYYQLQKSIVHISDPHGLENHLVEQLKRLISCNAILVFHNNEEQHALVARNPYNPRQRDEESLQIHLDDPLGNELWTGGHSIYRNLPKQPLLPMMRTELLSPLNSPDSILGCIYVARENPRNFTLHETTLIEFAAGLLAFALQRQSWESQSRMFDREVQQWRERYAALLQAFPGAVLIVDAGSGKIEEANEAAIHLFGGDSNVLLEKSISEIFSTQDEIEHDGQLLWNKVKDHPQRRISTTFYMGSSKKELIVLLPSGEPDTDVNGLSDLARAGAVQAVADKLQAGVNANDALVEFIAHVAMTVEKLIRFDYFSITLMNEQGGAARSFVLCRSTLKSALPASYGWSPVQKTDFGWVSSSASTAAKAPEQSLVSGDLAGRLPFSISFLLMHKDHYVGNWAFGREAAKFEAKEQSFLRALSPHLSTLIVDKIEALRKKVMQEMNSALARLAIGLASVSDEAGLIGRLRRALADDERSGLFIGEIESAHPGHHMLDFFPPPLQKCATIAKVEEFIIKLASEKRIAGIFNVDEFQRCFCEHLDEGAAAFFFPFLVAPIIVNHRPRAFVALPWTEELPMDRFEQDFLFPLDKMIGERLQAIELQKNVSVQHNEMMRLMRLVRTDFRTPVKELKGIAALLSQRYDKSLPDESQAYLRRILSDLDAVEKIIAGMELYQSLDELEEETLIDVKTVVRQAWEVTVSRVEAAHVQAVFPERFPKILGYREAFKQIFIQLFANAVRAVSDSDEPKVSVKVFETPTYFEFSVRDNGPGIDAVLQDKVFELFYKKEDDHQTAGLGLAIAKKAVQAHGGHIRVLSTENGAEFRFTIPRPSAVVSHSAP